MTTHTKTRLDAMLDHEILASGGVPGGEAPRSTWAVAKRERARELQESGADMNRVSDVLCGVFSGGVFVLSAEPRRPSRKRGRASRVGG